MFYKKNINEVIDRQKRFWNRETPNGILVRISVPWKNQVINNNDFYFDYTDINQIAKTWEAIFESKKDINDDSIPIMFAEFGGGLTGAYFGKELKFKGGTSWSETVIKKWDDLEVLKYDPRNKWIKKVHETTKYFLERGEGRYFTGVVNHFGPGDFAHSLRGNEIFYDFYDNKKEVFKLLNFAIDFTMKLINKQFSIIGLYKNGNFDSMGFYLPGKTINISEDVFCLGSNEIFKKFGIPSTQELINNLNGGWIHLHSKGIHLLEDLVKLKKIKGIQIQDDPGEIPVFKKIKDIKKIVGDLPINISCNKEEFKKAINNKKILRNIAYDISVATKSEANEIIEIIRNY